MHVTVLMSVFNGARWVGRAVESIQRQTYQDWDLLIVEDASTDGSREILHGIAAADRRVSLLLNPVNRGLAASLNAGWRAARGELIARMDHDDESLPCRLERQVAFMRQHPEVDVLGTAAELVDPRGNTLGSMLRPAEHQELVGRIFRETPFIHPSVMVRKQFYAQTQGYDERLRRAQDYDLWLRARGRFCFHNLQEPLIRYTVPERITLKTTFWGTYMLARAAYRERSPLALGRSALRYLAANTLVSLGCRRSGLRPTEATCLPNAPVSNSRSQAA